MDVNQAWIVFNFEEDKMHRKEWLWAANHLDAEFHIVAPISALRPIADFRCKEQKAAPQNDASCVAESRPLPARVHLIT
jgi:hypothetical protein